MRIYKCDICGKLKDEPEGNLSITHGLVTILDIDLCSECLNGVKRWAKENISRKGRDYERNN